MYYTIYMKLLKINWIECKKMDRINDRGRMFSLDMNSLGRTGTLGYTG
jgi:hypothetical protein